MPLNKVGAIPSAAHYCRYAHHPTTQAFGHAVAVPANFDIAILGDMTDIEVSIW